MQQEGVSQFPLIVVWNPHNVESQDSLTFASVDASLWNEGDLVDICNEPDDVSHGISVCSRPSAASPVSLSYAHQAHINYVSDIPKCERREGENHASDSRVGSSSRGLAALHLPGDMELDYNTEGASLRS